MGQGQIGAGIDPPVPPAPLEALMPELALAAPAPAPPEPDPLEVVSPEVPEPHAAAESASSEAKKRIVVRMMRAIVRPDRPLQQHRARGYAAWSSPIARAWTGAGANGSASSRSESRLARACG
jgi:hypothetical protein